MEGGGGRLAVLLALSLLLAGCLPSACNREQSRALLPADSLSRAFAAGLVPDTLQPVWAVPDAAALAYPRTVRFGPSGRLYVTDAEAHRLLVLDSTGALVETVAPDTWRYPYLAGLRGDTAVVFLPDLHRLDFVVDGAVARQVMTPPDLPRTTLQYAAATPSALYLKATGGDLDTAFVARLDADGTLLDRTPLAGPSWRYAGLLRTRGDTLLSLAGYRPVVDVVLPDGRRDTLTLLGFDSPMLARSRAFVQGEEHEAPLLTASAAAAGDALFVINMRPGWLHLDVYDADGRIVAQLVEPQPGYDKQFFPVDLDARRGSDGSYRIAVAIAKPEPRVQVYRWTPAPRPGAAAPSRADTPAATASD